MLSKLGADGPTSWLSYPSHRVYYFYRGLGGNLEVGECV